MMNPRPDELFEWVDDPPTGPLPLLIMLDGWIEASEAMARTNEVIVNQADLRPVARFDTDQLLDQRAHRPSITLIDGVMQPLEWPRLTVSIGTDRHDRPFLYLCGPEPDFSWKPFAGAVSTIAETIGVSGMFTVNAYPVPAPHTRPVRVSCISNCAELLIGRTKNAGSLTVPVGAQMAISEELLASGIHSIGVYAQVPYYISTTPWPQASIGLLETLHQVAKLEFDTSLLEAQVGEAIATVDATLADAPSLANVVSELEQRFDDLRAIEEAGLPSGDQLEAELQEFLRDIDDV